LIIIGSLIAKAIMNRRNQMLFLSRIYQGLLLCLLVLLKTIMDAVVAKYYQYKVWDFSLI